jgi:hypothetical protein
VDLTTRILGGMYPNTITTMANLANIYIHLGRYTERLLITILDERTRMKHPDTITAKVNLAATCRALGKYKEANKMETHVLTERTDILGKKHPSTLTAMANFADTYRCLWLSVWVSIPRVYVLARKNICCAQEYW